MRNPITESQVTGNPEAVLLNKAEKRKGDMVKVQSRFGEVTINKSKAVSFPHGMPGIPGSMSFCLADLPNGNGQFRLLQCIENDSLSFIVVPAIYDNRLLEPADIDEAIKILGINRENLLVLFIVTAHEENGQRWLSVNAKAPVFMDTMEKKAVQYVFQGDKYSIQHRIS